MPTWLTFFISLIVVVGGLGGLYLAVTFAVEGLRTKARPRMGLTQGGDGKISVWSTWNPEQFAVQIYRIRISHASPDSDVKEGTFTVTFDNAQTAPFIQPIELPPTFRAFLERNTGEKALFTFDVKSVEEFTLSKSYTLKAFKNIYQGKSGKSVPKGLTQMPVAKEDHPTVFSLDFSELQVRRKKLKELEAAAKAKAAAKAAAPAPAAKPAAAAAPVAAAGGAAPVAAAAPAAPAVAPAAVAPAPAPKPAPAAAAPTPAPAPVAAAPAPKPAPVDQPVAKPAPVDQPVAKTAPVDQPVAKTALTPEAAKAAPEAQPAKAPEGSSTAAPKSVRDVVSASNKKVEKPNE